MLKQWIDAGKCLLGMHKGEWIAEGSGSCVSVQTCELCGKATQRIEHLWGTWAAPDEHCISMRRCTRCADAESQIEHRWGGWGYPEEAVCEQRQRCDGCGAWSDEQRIAHRWQPWEYSEDCRAPLRTCARCGIRASYFHDQLMDPAAAPMRESDTARAKPVAVAPVRRPEYSCSEITVEVDAILRDIEAELTHHPPTPELSERAIARMIALTASTPDDERVRILGLLRLADLFGTDNEQFARLRKMLLTGLDALDPSAPPAAVQLIRLRCDAAVAELSTTLEREGFSEFAFQRASNALQTLNPGDAAELDAFVDGMMAAIDVTLPYAPADSAEVLRGLRDWLPNLREVDGPEETITKERMLAESSALREELKAKLRAGGLPAATITVQKFQMYWMRLLLRLARSDASEDDEKGQEFVALTMSEGAAFLEILQPFAPAGTEYTVNTLTDAFAKLSISVDVLSSDDVVAQAAAAQAISEDFDRAQQAFRWGGITGSAHLQQLLNLLPSFTNRFSELQDSVERGSHDEAELEELKKRAESPQNLLKVARTEEQVIKAQRDGLRRAALELRQFERRHHLMLIHPDLPATQVDPHANCAFFSGSQSVGALLKKAVDRLGMDLPVTLGPNNELDERWNEMLQSSIAVFDYTGYHPPQAEATKTRSRNRRAVLDPVMGQTAIVSYETGWAYVLGTPMIIVAKKGRPLPFDVDIEPVLLEDDDQDADRLVSAIQIAIYGTQYGEFAHSVADTVAYVRARYVASADSRVTALLGAPIDPRDATKTRRVLADALGRIRTERARLAFPAFPPAYPPEGKRRLFHITAFRDWAKVVEDETRGACKRHDIDYGIGYERITPNILRGIWNDICRASFVVADITSLNPNAVLELAIAQAVGRRTLVLTQDERPHDHFPAIRKVRTHRYNPTTGRDGLSRLLDGFLAGNE